MNRDDENSLVLAVITYLLGRSVMHSIEWGNGWVWPVPDIETSDGTHYAPVISQEFKPGAHAGVDVMFRRKSATDRATAYPAGGLNGSPRYFAPPGTPVVAARAGRVWSARRSPRGISVVVDHGRPFATFYQHLETLAVTAGSEVKAGQVIGTMGWDPLDAEKLRHLHFAVWHLGAGDNASVDPAVAMASWYHAPLPHRVT